MQDQNQNSQFFVIEGEKDILELLETNQKIQKILWHKKAVDLKEFSQIKEIAISQNIEIIEITNNEFRDLRRTVHSKGFFAFIKKIEYDLSEILKKSKFVIVLDRIQDPGNLGTIVRTASVLGVDAILLTKNSIKISNPKALRAVKGYFGSLPILEDIDENELLENLKKEKFNKFSADMTGSDICDKNIKTEKPLALFFGSEGQGLSEYIKQNTEKISIPMKKTSQSLNLAVSVGIIIFEVNKRWK